MTFYDGFLIGMIAGIVLASLIITAAVLLGVRGGAR